MEKTAVNPASLHPPANGAYSHAIRTGRLLFISGQVALDKEGRIVGPGDIRKQTEQVFENLKAILEAAGGTLDNLISWNGYMVNMQENYAGYARVRALYLVKDPKPASALVEVKGLLFPELLLEIQGVALVE